MRRVKVGIIGTGKMARAHAGGFAETGSAELAACFDVAPGRAEAFAREMKVARVARSVEELVRQVDAVSVVTPDRFHAEIALEVLAAGKHLLCEKPLATSLRDARRLAAAARKASARGVVHMVNFTYRRSAAVARAAELVRAGKLGALRHVHGFYLQTWLSAPVWGAWTDEAWLWRLETDAGSGGVLGDVGCHILDLATAVAGPATRIRCDLRTFPKVTAAGKAVTEWKGRKLDANDTAVIEAELDGGAITVIHATRWATGHKNHLRLEVHGTEGALAVDLDRSWEEVAVSLGKDAKAAEWRTMRLKPAPSLYARFIRAIRRGVPAAPDVVRGAEVQAQLDACERSARSGRWERVGRV